MRPRSRSTSTTRTEISSPLLRTSSTVPTRWPGETLEMCSRPSVPLASSTKAPNVVVLTTFAPGNSSPTSTSLVIERMRSASASPWAPVCAYTRTLPSSSTSICASYSSCSERIVSPPLPISRPILSGSILIAEMRGANSDSSVRGSPIASAILPRMNERPSLACVSASRRISNVTPVILMSICRAVMPFSVPATLKSMSPRWSSTPAMSESTT